MARPWRIKAEGAYYHVLSRGNERRDIFIDDRDRKLFLTTLSAVSHIVGDLRELMKEEPRIGGKVRSINSQFKM